MLLNTNVRYTPNIMSKSKRALIDGSSGHTGHMVDDVRPEVEILFLGAHPAIVGYFDDGVQRDVLACIYWRGGRSRVRG